MKAETVNIEVAQPTGDMYVSPVVVNLGETAIMTLSADGDTVEDYGENYQLGDSGN